MQIPDTKITGDAKYIEVDFFKKNSLRGKHLKMFYN